MSFSINIDKHKWIMGIQWVMYLVWGHGPVAPKTKFVIKDQYSVP